MSLDVPEDTFVRSGQDGKTKVMTLEADEFIRRFLQYTVPDGFLANCHRTAWLASAANCSPCRHRRQTIHPRSAGRIACATLPVRTASPAPLLRWPDGDLWYAAATPSHVVRQLMTQPSSPPVRSGLPGTADHGASRRVLGGARSVAGTSAVSANGVTSPMNRPPACVQSIAPATAAARTRHTNSQRTSSIGAMDTIPLDDSGRRVSPTRFSLTGAPATRVRSSPASCGAPPSEKRTSSPCVIFGEGYDGTRRKFSGYLTRRIAGGALCRTQRRR